MNLLRIVELLRSERAALEKRLRCGFFATDDRCGQEGGLRHLPGELNAKLTYVVAGNENLASDLCRELRSRR